MNEFKLGNRMVGSNHPPLVIAEIGINHNGSLKNAISLADDAIDAGIEVIKHQTHVVEDEMTSEAKSVIPGNSDKSIYQIMEECALSEEDEISLKNHVESRGKIFLSTPFSRAAADRLENMGVCGYKIGSGECNNYPLIEHIAAFKKPIILSTGMNNIESVRPAVEIIR
ncbi:MAG: N-acetylneuraminate synthase family protein, partial [Gammaproteobacteria bacterium]